MAKKEIKCCDCSIKLNKNEIALSKKMLGREIVEFMCVSCFADYLSCSVSDLEIKIQEFKEQGCALFL
jgi:hypothetical protein